MSIDSRVMRSSLYALVFLFLLSGLNVDLIHTCTLFGYMMNIRTETERLGDFREQNMSQEILEQLERMGDETGASPGEILSVWMPLGNFQASKRQVMTKDCFLKWREYFLAYRKQEYKNLLNLYRAVWDDLVYFPTCEGVTYEDSWMAERTYGGKRGHEGCDLMPQKNQSGIYPVFSMTDGVVEKIGWLEKGGLRIGIRSPHGGYFYYAHLSDYAMDFEIGQKVRAGDLLGYMGDTGYGPKGTRGKFDVHLHLGIYVSTPKNPEISVNPYWILRSLEGHELKCRYEM